jgi:signal transduction histidine kinase
MNKLVNDLLLLARLDQGRELEFTRINICDIVREAVADASLSNTDREIALNCPDEVLYDGDQDRIRQLVSNLLNNAFDHTPEGTSVEISLYQSEESVILEVSDQGSGVEPELQEKIFDRFVSTKNLRADELSKSISSGAVIGDGENTESTSNDETRTQSTGHDAFLGGTGLGLSIARAIARGHGGDIELVANGEKGAKFKVTLPKSASLRSGKS